MRRFLHERFHPATRKTEDRRTEPQGAEASIGARKSRPGKDRRQAAARSVRGILQGQGFLRQHQEDDLPAQSGVVRPTYSLLSGAPFCAQSNAAAMRSNSLQSPEIFQVI